LSLLQRDYKLQYVDAELIKFSPKYIGKGSKFEVGKYNSSLAILNGTLHVLKDFPAQTTVSDGFNVFPLKKLRVFVNRMCGGPFESNRNECINFKNQHLPNCKIKLGEAIP
jgi:hypothetical protein